MQLALGLLSYMAGQVFGPGVAIAAGRGERGAVRGHRRLLGPRPATNSARANRIATGVHAMAISTIVVFPPVISPPSPVS